MTIVPDAPLEAIGVIMVGPSSSPASAIAPAARPRRGGFTLLETALATVILGVGVLALIDAHESFTRHNRFSSSSMTGAYLAGEVRERMRGLPRHDPVNGLRVDRATNPPTVRGWGREPNETSVYRFNDVDDFDGVTFGNGGQFPGPIDCTGQTIHEINAAGEAVVDDEGAARSMRGWSQTVTVQKVDPYNFAQARATGYEIAPDLPNFAGVAVDRFPLRVTVVVRYQDPASLDLQEMARLTWVVP